MKKILIPIVGLIFFLYLIQISYDNPMPKEESEINRYQFFAHPTTVTLWGFIDTQEGFVLIMSPGDSIWTLIDLKTTSLLLHKGQLKKLGMQDSLIHKQAIWRIFHY